MLSEIDSVLKIGTQTSLMGENIGICETSTDGTWLIHYFLNANLKEKRPVCFLSFTQSFNHFNSVSQKLAIGLQSARTAEYLDFIEGLKHVGDAICDEALALKDDIDQMEKDSDAFLLMVKSKTLKPLLILLKNRIKKKFEEFNCMPVVIIDNISILLNIGISPKDVITFMHYLRNCLCKNVEEPGLLVALVSCTESDEQSDVVWKYMCHSSSITLHVAGLDSGYCKDVHGEISVTWRDGYCSHRKISSKKFQFKLSEKNINIFAVGMSSAVL